MKETLIFDSDSTILCPYPPSIKQWADMEVVAHRTTNSQQRLSLTCLQVKLQAAEQLVSPGSILFTHRSRPATLGPTHVRTVSQDMDKRHPSSFQQLEKVHLNYLVFPLFPVVIMCDFADMVRLTSSGKEHTLRYAR